MKRRGNHAAAIAVVGGAGAMGRITARDLAETAAPEIEVVIADQDGPAARRLARDLGGGRVRGMAVDVADPAATARALDGAFAIVNCCPHDFNLRVMQAALNAGAHYCD